MSSKRIGVLVSGGGTNLQAIIDGTKSNEISGEVVLVISNNKNAYGLTRAEEAGINNIFLDREKYETEEEYNRELLKKLKGSKIDLLVLAGYLRVLPKLIIEEYRNKIINVHPSLIPSFCGKGFYGSRVHKAAIDYGVKVSGATVHFVDEGTDTGPIILQDIVEIEAGDNWKDLQKKVLKKEHKLLVRAVSLFCEDRLELKGRIVSII